MAGYPWCSLELLYQATSYVLHPTIVKFSILNSIQHVFLNASLLLSYFLFWLLKSAIPIHKLRYLHCLLELQNITITFIFFLEVSIITWFKLRTAILVMFKHWQWFFFFFSLGPLLAKPALAGYHCLFNGITNKYFKSKLVKQQLLLEHKFIVCRKKKWVKFAILINQHTALKNCIWIQNNHISSMILLFGIIKLPLGRFCIFSVLGSHVNYSSFQIISNTV